MKMRLAQNDTHWFAFFESLNLNVRFHIIIFHLNVECYWVFLSSKNKTPRMISLCRGLFFSRNWFLFHDRQKLSSFSLRNSDNLIIRFSFVYVEMVLSSIYSSCACILFYVRIFDVNATSNYYIFKNCQLNGLRFTV